MDERSIVSPIATDPQTAPPPELKEDTRALVLQLKASLKAKNLTVQDVIDMCDGKPNMPSETSIKRVFAPASENKQFNYRLTLKPLLGLLLDISPEAAVVPPTASEEQQEIASLKGALIAKDQYSESLEREKQYLLKLVDSNTADHERQVGLFMNRLEKLDAELAKIKAENEALDKEIKDAAKEKQKVENSRKKWAVAAFVVLIAFVLYLLILDIPNPDYGIFNFNAFVDNLKDTVRGRHTAGSVIDHVSQWLRV